MKKIEIRDGDDWFEILIDDILVYEGHRPSHRDWIELLLQGNVATSLPNGFFNDAGEWELYD